MGPSENGSNHDSLLLALKHVWDYAYDQRDYHYKEVGKGPDRGMTQKQHDSWHMRLSNNAAAMMDWCSGEMSKIRARYRPD